MRVVEIMGGLGNQMFDFAFLMTISDIYKQQTRISTIEIEKNFNHNGYELDKVFGINTPRFNIEHSFFKTKLSKKYIIKRYYEKQEFEYDIEILKLNSKRPIKYYSGYWQNELYFKNIEDEIRKVFSFNEQNFSEKTTHLAKIIRSNKNSVSIHIRRGDYYNNPEASVIHGNICSVEYYNNAIKEIKSRVKDASFYIFSDEPQWVKENFTILEGSTIIDWNKKSDSWQDMALMSYCTHHIIANSSFSWWGAWLSAPHTEKIVIAPDKWLNKNSSSTSIIPDRWIKVPTI